MSFRKGVPLDDPDPWERVEAAQVEALAADVKRQPFRSSSGYLEPADSTEERKPLRAPRCRTGLHVIRGGHCPHCDPEAK